MKITGVEAIHLRLPVVYETADGSQDVLIVRVQTDDGITGIGEVVSAASIAKAIIEAPRSALRRHGLASIVMGQDPLAIGRVWHEMLYHSAVYGGRGPAIHAMSGIDIALWDIAGKVAGQPVSQLLGGAYRSHIPAYASELFRDSPEQTADLAARLIDEWGFRALKFGWGNWGRNMRRDLAQVEHIRRRVGPDIDLMIDVGAGWDAPMAFEMGRRLQPYDLLWVEEPLARDDLRGYRELCGSGLMRIAAGEATTRLDDFQTLIDTGVDVIQADVCSAGGLTVCRELSTLTSRQHVWCVPHCFSTGINLVASLHWAAAMPDARYVEYCTRESPFLHDLVVNVPRLENGLVPIPTEPGLGIELNEEVIARYRV